MIWYDDIDLLTAIGLTPVTITHKQYTEQHNEREYPERNKNNNKNI
jgi:hypothetical protein